MLAVLQPLLDLSWTHIAPPADRVLLRCLCRACGHHPYPYPVLFPALTHRKGISGSSGGWMEVTLAPSVPLGIHALGLPGFPSLSLPTPISFSTCWEPRDEQGNEGGPCLKEDARSGWASLGWWGQGERSPPFPGVGGRGREEVSEAAAETLALVGAELVASEHRHSWGRLVLLYSAHSPRYIRHCGALRSIF